MRLRAKLLLLFFGCGVLPMILLGIINYAMSVRAVRNLVRHDTEERALRVARVFAESLNDRETNLIELASAPSLRAYLKQARLKQAHSENAAQRPDGRARAAAVPDDVRTDVGAFFREYREYYAALTCLDADGQALFRLATNLPDANRLEPIFQTQEQAARYLSDDVRAWRASSPTAKQVQHTAVAREPFGAGIRYIVPVLEDGAPQGAIVAEVKLNSLFRDAESGYVETMPPLTAPERSDALTNHYSIVLDGDGEIMYHTNSALRFQAVALAMPYFAPVADVMRAAARDGRKAGVKFFNDADGREWLAAFRPLGDFHLAIAVVENYSSAIAGVRRAGEVGVLISILATSLAAVILTLIVGRVTHEIGKVASAAARIAEGKLEQTIAVRANDETRTLAESFNQMSARLREMIARETESKQFEAFMRISAMLTHDLKNAIGALNLLVKNMEREHSNFNARTIRGLRLTADTLRGLVARLTNPAQMLSEERRAARLREFDLGALMREVLARTTSDAMTRDQEQAAEKNPDAFYKLETALPDAPVFVRGDAEQLEKVFENLIINAKEAMHAEDGQLKIAVEENGEKVIVTVSDNGRGMDEEFKNKRLFRPFATTKERGFGLGLYTCREIVEAHGGRITVESTLGIGTTFRVVLPSARNTASNEAIREPTEKI
jgi:signal transduction histidine kinase